MINSWEIEEFESPALFQDLAVGHIDGSISLTRDMLDDSFESSFSHSRVILSLAYHGAELFLKGAICGKTMNPKIMGSHDLRSLKEEYDRIYPDSKYELSLPFVYEYLGYNPTDKKEMMQDEPPQDQTFRYHTDKSGTVWKGFKSQDGITAFLPNSFITTISEFRQRISVLGDILHKEQH